MDGSTAIVYLACLIILLIVGRVFYIPLKHVIKLLLNTLLGGILIYIVNIVGGSYNFHIGLNYITAFFAGIFRCSGCVDFSGNKVDDLIKSETFRDGEVGFRDGSFY